MTSAYMQVIELDHDFGETFCGVVTDQQGHMTALWANYNEQSGSDDMEEYCRGIPVAVIKPWLQQVGLSWCSVSIKLASVHRHAIDMHIDICVCTYTSTDVASELWVYSLLAS